jgi:hypothetical protein
MPLEMELKELVSLANQLDKQNTKISAASVGWHIDHSLKVVINTCEAIKKSNPEEYKWRFNFSRFVVFTLGSFPRGSAKAPKSVIPDGEVTEQAIVEQFQRARSLIKDVVTLPAKSNFYHPYFGSLQLSGFLKFLSIHTSHHVKISKDIIKRSNKA